MRSEQLSLLARERLPNLKDFMAVCVTNDLLAANPCYAALSPFEQDVVLTQMLCSLLSKLTDGTAISCDIQTLLTDGKCFAAMPPFILKTLQLQLMCEISAAV